MARPVLDRGAPGDRISHTWKLPLSPAAAHSVRQSAPHASGAQHAARSAMGAPELRHTKGGHGADGTELFGS